MPEKTEKSADRNYQSASGGPAIEFEENPPRVTDEADESLVYQRIRRGGR